MPTLTLPRPNSAQQTVMAEAKRFNVVCCGRRWEKTELGIRPRFRRRALPNAAPVDSNRASHDGDGSGVLAKPTRRACEQTKPPACLRAPDELFDPSVL